MNEEDVNGAGSRRRGGVLRQQGVNPPPFFGRRLPQPLGSHGHFEGVYMHVFQDDSDANSLGGASQDAGQVLEAMLTFETDPDDGLSGREAAGIRNAHIGELPTSTRQ